MQQHNIDRDDAPDLSFVGELLGVAKSSPNQASASFSGSTGRWQVLRLYRTRAGRYVCHRKNRTEWDGERDTSVGRVCTTEAEVFEFFGYGELAKELYSLAGITPIESIE